MADLTLQPARPDSPASFVAALGAADILAEDRGEHVSILWTAPDRHGHFARMRPTLRASTMSAEQMADTIARTPLLDQDILMPPGTSRQSLRRAIVDAYPDLSPIHAIEAEMHRLRDHPLESRWLEGTIGVRGPRRNEQLYRHPLTRCAKADIAEACDRHPEPLTATEVLAELDSPEWAWSTERNGDWGLCAELNSPQARHLPYYKRRTASRTLARLLLRGILASWHDRQTQGIPDLVWPIWRHATPYQMLASWLGWQTEPTTVLEADEHDDWWGGYRSGYDWSGEHLWGATIAVPRFPGVDVWLRSPAAPITTYQSLWQHADGSEQMARALSGVPGARTDA